MEILGKNVKPQTLGLVGIGVVVLGIGYYRYQKTQKTDAAAAAAATAPGTGAGSSDAVDPATGFAYGSAEDAAALTAQSGYNFPSGSGGGGGGTYPSSGGTGFTSNAAWSQAAESFLINQEPNADPNAVGNALGKYITGGTVTDAASQGYINQAIAFEGYPPVPGPNGFPPSIHTGPSPVGPGTGGGTGGGGTPKQNVVVPRVTGMSAANAFEVLRSEALNPEPGGIKKDRIVTATHPAAGKTVAKHTTVVVTVK